MGVKKELALSITTPEGDAVSMDSSVKRSLGELLGNKYIVVLFAILVCLIPALLLAQWKATDPYFNTVVSQIMTAFDGGKLLPVTHGNIEISDPNKLGHIGFQGLLLALAKILGVSPKYLQFIPIGGLIVPFLYYLLIRKITESNWIAFLLAVYVGYESMLSINQYNLHAYVWSHFLFLSFFILCIRILHRRTAVDVILLFIVYVGTFLIYWTTPIWMITLWASIMILPILLAFTSKTSRPIGRYTISMVLVFVIIYLVFSQVLYQYIPVVVRAEYGDPEAGLELYIWQLLNVLFGRQPSTPYEYAGSSLTNPWLGWLLALRKLSTTLTQLPWEITVQVDWLAPPPRRFPG